MSIVSAEGQTATKGAEGLGDSQRDWRRRRTELDGVCPSGRRRSRRLDGSVSPATSFVTSGMTAITRNPRMTDAASRREMARRTHGACRATRGRRRAAGGNRRRLACRQVLVGEDMLFQPARDEDALSISTLADVATDGSSAMRAGRRAVVRVGQDLPTSTSRACSFWSFFRSGPRRGAGGATPCEQTSL